MGHPASKPDKWTFVCTDTQGFEEPCAQDFTGKQAGWLRKIKHNGARGKWLSDTNWRFVTVDFDDQIILYSNTESSKTQSFPIKFTVEPKRCVKFTDIVDVKLLDRSLERSLTERLLGNANDVDMGVCLITSEREIRLLSKTMDGAKQWVSIFAAARRIAQAQLTMDKSPSIPSMCDRTWSDRFSVDVDDSAESPSSGSSTAPGSEAGPHQFSDRDSDDLYWE